MDKQEIRFELDMPYQELVSHLLQKYGAAPYDYFTNEACTSKSKRISRTADGLFCHHIDEDKGYLLSDRYSAVRYPFSYQRANRLVYCNYLEHLILHIKIGIDTYWTKFTELNQPSNIPYLINPGFGVLAQEINTLFDDSGSTVQWRQRCFEEIKDNYEDYIYILKWFFTYIDKKYIPGTINYTKNQIIKHPTFGYGIIIGFKTKPIDLVCIKFGKTEKKIARTFLEKSEYKETVCRLKESFSRTHNGRLVQTTFDLLQRDFV